MLRTLLERKARLRELIPKNIPRRRAGNLSDVGSNSFSDSFSNELNIADDKSKRGNPDRERIDVNDPDEVRNWSKSLRTRPEKLKEAVKAVGTTASTVREHLQGR